MRSNNNILLLGLAAFLLYRHFQGDASSARLFSSVRLRMTDISINQNAVVIKFNVQNPTSQKLLFKSLVGDVYLNNEKIGNAESFTETWLPIGNTTITVRVNMKVYNLVQQVASAIQYRSGAALSFNGSINLNDKIIPVATTYRIA